jgi:hypothetical protein
MGLIPHPQIPLGGVRPADILLLLAVGAVWEVIIRVILWGYKTKPKSIKTREWKLKELERRVRQSRNKGAHAFVETSKLERQQLAEEKALASLAEARKADLVTWEKLIKKLNMGLSVAIFFVYYGVPLVELTADRVVPMGGEILSTDEAHIIAESTMKAFLFPLSVIGAGMRFSRWGLAKPQLSIGALVVFWSAQTTVGKIFDGIEALSY